MIHEMHGRLSVIHIEVFAGDYSLHQRRLYRSQLKPQEFGRSTNSIHRPGSLERNAVVNPFPRGKDVGLNGLFQPLRAGLPRGSELECNVTGNLHQDSLEGDAAA